MSTIAIISPSSVPFQIGGAEKFWWGLHKGLTEHSGAFVELLKLPCYEETFHGIVASYRMFSEQDLSHFDMVITSKYPAWMIEHPNHVVYLQHPLRGLYDTYHFTNLPETLAVIPTPLRTLMTVLRKTSPTREDLALAFDLIMRAQETKSLSSSLFAFPGPLIREVVHFFDRVALAPSQITAYAAISETVKHRKEYFPPDAEVKVIHHPSDIINFIDTPGEYIFTASRLTNMKRLHLVVEAMRHVDVAIPLRIAGTGPELERLKTLAGNDRRIEFLGHVPDAQLPELYGGALFVPFVPYDEDYGLITIEAMRSGKPVVTVNDAGGVCEFVFNDKTGYCVEPTPEALGAAMQRLAANPALARELGRNAQALVADITWPRTVEALLEHVHRTSAVKNAQGRRKILVATTFSAAYPVSGGQRRVHQLCLELSKTYFVEFVCIGGKDQNRIIRTKVSSFFHEICLPWCSESLLEEKNLTALTGASVGDIACMDTCAEDTTLLKTLRDCGSDADLVIASHPYLYPVLKKVLGDKPLFYDAHNVEADMKAVVLADYAESVSILDRVAAVEHDCCSAAERILVCSDADSLRFSDLYGITQERTLVVPNGYDANLLPYMNRMQRSTLRKRLGYEYIPLALFMGSMHRPNIEAVQHIKNMASIVTEMQFLIAGSVGDDPNIQEKTPDNVYFLGVITEKEKNVLLNVVDFGLNPMTSGSGTNLKILEYIAVGLETVSTPFGLRGLDNDAQLRSGVWLCEIDAFPETLRKALHTPLPEQALATAAQRMEELFSWEKAMAPVSKAVATVFASASTGGAECP